LLFEGMKNWREKKKPENEAETIRGIPMQNHRKKKALMFFVNI